MTMPALSTTTAILHLKPGREKPVLNRHPWVFSGAIARLEGVARPGDLVEVVSARDEWLARAYYNPHSQIRGRILTWDPGVVVDEAFWQERLERAIAGRTALELGTEGSGAMTTAFRLVNAEADGLPGLVVDRYGEYLVMQAATAGIDRRKEMLADLLQTLCQPAGILERSDLAVRRKEGLPQTVAVLRGSQPPGTVTIRENGLAFHVDLISGHKTGFYLDQRDNRALVCHSRFVAGTQLLNVFSYTGGFGVYAAANGASSVTHLDSSIEALKLAEGNMAENGYDNPDHEYLAGDAFEVLRHYRDTGRQFEVVILDPPKFAHVKGDVKKACRGYKDLNWLAMRLLPPGGLLATFSCSGLVSADLFQKVLFGAALDAGREVQVLVQLGQAADHPILLSFPESAYLKGFLCRVW